MRLTTGLGLLGLLAAPALANDTTAQLTTGGLEFVTSQTITMVSEDLYISPSEVRVTYVFRNDGDEDETVLVAFPMPEITHDDFEMVAYPRGPLDNPFEFETTFEGEPVSSDLYQYAFALGIDRSVELEDLGIPLENYRDETREALAALDEAALDDLRSLGLLAPSYEEADGTQSYQPAWTLRSTYAWEATFPAGEEVTVTHRYTPSVGGTVAVTFLDPALEYAAQYATRYCPTPELIADLEASLPTPGDLFSAPYYENWISYVLSTGGNWNGAIGRFHLTVDTEDPDVLASFCAPAFEASIEQTGPTTYEVTAADFFPSRELDILLLVPQE